MKRSIKELKKSKITLKIKKQDVKGITLVALVVTIIVLLILAGIGVSLSIRKNGIFNKAEIATEEHNKQTATEIMNMKITGIQIESYSENRKLANLQYLANKLCEDDDMDYVIKKTEPTSSLPLLPLIDVKDVNSIYTKLKKYPYEFEINEINGELQLASIDGIKIANANSSQIEEAQNRIKELEELNKNLNLQDEESQIKIKELEEANKNLNLQVGESQSKVKELEESNKNLNSQINELKSKSNKVKIHYLGRYNSTYKNTINVSSYEGYEKFTVNNFIVKNFGLQSVQGELTSSHFEYLLNKNSYNSSKGILTTDTVVDPSYNWTRSINFELYLIQGEVEK